MPPSIIMAEPSPRRPTRLRTVFAQPPVVVRPMPVSTPPQAITRARPGPALHPIRPPHRRSRPIATGITAGIVAVALMGGVVATLLLTGQDELVAWLIVGAVVLVVFGTPLLCLFGLMVFWYRALSRAGQRRSLPRQQRPASPTQPIIVGEVVFDD